MVTFSDSVTISMYCGVLQIHLCCGSNSLCKGILSLSGLSSTNLITTTVPLGTGEFVRVYVCVCVCGWVDREDTGI